MTIRSQTAGGKDELLVLDVILEQSSQNPRQSGTTEKNFEKRLECRRQLSPNGIQECGQSYSRAVSEREQLRRDGRRGIITVVAWMQSWEECRESRAVGAGSRAVQILLD